MNSVGEILFELILHAHRHLSKSFIDRRSIFAQEDSNKDLTFADQG